MPRKKDPNSLTQSYTAFLKAHPEPLGDAGKLFAYMVFSCPPQGGMRFCYADDTTKMKAMGWRSLDRVDAATKELQERHFLSERVTETRSVGDEQEGYFLYPAGDAPVAIPVEAPASVAAPCTPPPGLFGTAKINLEPPEEGPDESEGPDEPEPEVHAEEASRPEEEDPHQTIYDVVREHMFSFKGVALVEDVQDLICSAAALRHLPRELVEAQVSGYLAPKGMFATREYGKHRFVAEGRLRSETSVPDSMEFHKLADAYLRHREVRAAVHAAA